MPQRRFTALVLAAVALLAACGSPDDSDAGKARATADGDMVDVGPAPMPGNGVGSLGDAVAIAAGAPAEATDAACTIDRQTLETAVEAYEMLNGSLPAGQQELVDAQMIRELSPNFEVGTDGVLIPASGSPCP